MIAVKFTGSTTLADNHQVSVCFALNNGIHHAAVTLQPVDLGHATRNQQLFCLGQQHPPVFDGKLAFRLVDAGQFFQQLAFHAKPDCAAQILARSHRVLVLNDMQKLDTGLEPRCRPRSQLADAAGVGGSIDTGENAFHD